MSLTFQELDIEAAYHAVSDTYLGTDVDIHALCRESSLMNRSCRATLSIPT